MTAKTLIARLAEHAETTPSSPAIYEKNDAGEFDHLTWKQYWDAVREVAKGLIALGHEPEDCVAIVGDNRIDWVLCEFGIMAAQGVPAPIYTTNTVEQTAFIIDHAKAKIAICDKAEQLDKYKSCVDQELISIEKIVTMDPLPEDDMVMTLDALRALGREQDDDALDARIAAIDPDDTALLIYTSGTTGVPKAVMLEHAGILAVGAALEERAGDLLGQGEYCSVSYLPLCHVAEQIFTVICHLQFGGEVYFCAELTKVKDYLPVARPTIFAGVPRVWEKIQAALEARVAEASPIKRKLFAWARQKELDAYYTEMKTGQPVESFGLKMARKLVINKLKERLGMDHLAVAGSGAAPIALSTLEFFASIGIRIHEGYGMSETSGLATTQIQGRPKFGTVGKALKGVTIKIADDGEILLKGRNMTRGYLHNPEKTAELLDDDGWLHTGDLGSLDDEGYLSITGRKKDLIITAGGKNVAPAELEGYLKRIAGIGQAVVIGDQRKYLSALITLDPEALPELASAAGIPHGSLAEMAGNDKLQDHFMPLIEEHCNKHVARYQTIKRFVVLPVEFTVDTGELTPTMKIKRNVVNEKYADEIASLYPDA